MNNRVLPILTFNRIVPVVLWLIALFTLVTTIWATVSHYSVVPFWDQWNGTIGFYEKWLTEGADKIALLFSQHNEHRIALPRLFFLLDCELGRCDNSVSIVTIFITQLLTVVLLGYAFLKAGGARKDYFAFILPFLIIANYSWVQHENLTWGFQIQFVGVYFWGASSIIALALVKESVTNQRQVLLMATSLVAASFATFSMANGILVMPILILLAFFLRFSFKKHIALWLFMFLLAISYFRGYISPANHGQPLETLFKQPFELLAYACAYLGGVFRQGFSLFPKVSVILGGGYILLAGFFVILHLKGKQKLNNLQLALLAIAGFILLTAIVTGLGRVKFGIGQAFSSRYTTPVLIGWCSLFLLCWTYGKRTQKVAIIAGIVFLLALVKVQEGLNVNESGVVFNRDLGLLSVMLGTNDSVKIAQLYPSKEEVLERSTFLKNNNLSLYEYGFHLLLNKSLEDNYSGGLHDFCSGYFDTIKTDSNLEQGAVVEGWSWVTEERKPADYIVIADAERNVVGVAFSGVFRPDVAAVLGSRNKKAGWQGYVKDTPPKLTAYAVANNKICELNNNPDWPMLSLKRVETIEHLERSSIAYHIDGGWAVNGIYDYLEIQSLGSDALGSWNGDDAKKGTLEFGPLDVSSLDMLVWPMMTGPVNANQKIVLKSAISGDVLAEAKVPLLTPHWTYFEVNVNLPPQSKMEKVMLQFVDDGSGWGEWSAVGSPFIQNTDLKGQESGK